MAAESTADAAVRALGAAPRGVVAQEPGSTPWRAFHGGLVHCIYLYDTGYTMQTAACPGFDCESDCSVYYPWAMPELSGVARVPNDTVVSCMLCAGATYPEPAEGDLVDGDP